MEQEQALEALTQSLVNKILHTPFTELKQAAIRPDRLEFLEVVRTIFHLEDESRSEVSLAGSRGSESNGLPQMEQC